MADVELLEKQDVMASACERVRGRGSHDPRTDDSDLCLHGGIFASAQRECDLHPQLWRLVR